MLSTLCSVAMLSVSHSGVHLTPAQLVSNIRSCGYTVEPSGKDMAGIITAERLGHKERIGFVVAGVDADGQVGSIEFYGAYEFPRRLSLRALADWQYRTRSPLLVQTFLNRQVAVGMRQDLSRRDSNETFAAILERALSDFADFERWVCTPEGGKATEKVDFSAHPSDLTDRRVVDYLGYVDFTMLIKHWGWSTTKPYCFGLQSQWTLPMEIDGRLITVRPSAQSISGLVILADVAPTSDALARFQKAHPEDDVHSYGSSISVSQTMDLNCGMSLGQVKKTLRAFARKVSGLGPETLPPWPGR